MINGLLKQFNILRKKTYSPPCQELEERSHSYTYLLSCEEMRNWYNLNVCMVNTEVQPAAC